MLCPHCGIGNADEDRFCQECGKPLAEEAASLPPLQPAPPYHPSGRCPAKGFLMLLGTGIVAGLVVGGVYHLITRLIDLLILFPIGAGFCVGLPLAMAAGAGKCRNPYLAICVGLLAGLLAYGTKLFADSVQARPAIVQAFTKTLADEEVSEADIRSAVDEGLTPWQTFRIYMEISAEEGTHITHHGGEGIPLKGGAFWVLLGIEALIVGGVAAAIVQGQARSPYCEKCGQWFDETTILRAHPDQSTALLEKVQAQEWHEAGKLPAGGEMDDKNHCDVVVTRCGKCLATTVTVKETRAGKEHVLLNAAVSPESVARMVKDEPEPAAVA